VYAYPNKAAGRFGVNVYPVFAHALGELLDLFFPFDLFLRTQFGRQRFREVLTGFLRGFHGLGAGAEAAGSAFDFQPDLPVRPDFGIGEVRDAVFAHAFGELECVVLGFAARAGGAR
jgi:hypothetical protein